MNNSISNADNQRTLDFAIAIIVGTVAFLLVVGYKTLDPTNILWLVAGSADTSTHYIGWTYFLSDEWHWPLGKNPNYGLELSNSIIFSDSIPLLALFFKSIAPILPKPFQYTGWWILTCFILQAFFAIRITHLFNRNQILKILVALIIVFSPPFLYRLGAHFSLLPHWILLAAILVYFANITDSSLRKAKWGVLLICASLTHTYFLPMVLVIWLADIYQRCKQQDIRFTSKWAEALLMFFIIIFALWIAGFFPLEKSYLSGGYGVHRLNLLSLINPQGVSVVPTDLWSYILPPLPQGYGDYEGFNFLGAGSLLITLIGLFFLLKNRIDSAYNKKIIPIIIASIVLTLFAISNKIGIGTFTLEIWIPEILVRVGHVLRASGRFFWPVFYLIIFGAIWVTVRSIGNKKSIIIMAVLATLQITDTRLGWKAFDNKFQTTDSNWETNYDHPDLKVLAQHYTKLRALPLINAGKDWDKRSQFALKNNMQTDTIYLARYSYDSIALMKKIRGQIISSGLQRDSLYFLDEEIARLVFLNIKENDALFHFDEKVYIYAPNWSVIGEKITFEKATF